jgi:hypothetical protein
MEITFMFQMRRATNLVLSLFLTGAGIVCGVTVLGQEKKDEKAEAGAALKQESRDQARDIYYLSDKSGEIRYAGLRVRLYQPDGNCNLVEVAPSRKFRSGDGVRLAVESNLTGYLHVIAQSSSGGETLLFPNDNLNNGANQIFRNSELMIPGRVWLRFDKNPGVEKIVFVLTRRKVDLLPYILPLDRELKVPDPGGVEAVISDLLKGVVKPSDLIHTPYEKVAVGQPSASGVYAVNRSKVSNEYCVLQMTLNHN